MYETEQTGVKPATAEYPAYNYPQIFTEYLFQGQSDAGHRCPDHALVFVISGELTVRCSCGSTTITEGGYIFLRRDNNTLLERRSSAGKPFRSVFMGLNHCFLRKLHPVIDAGKFQHFSGGFEDNVIVLPQRPSLESLYISLLPYLQLESGPAAQLLEIKLIEAVYSLIQTDVRFYSCLFDFDTPNDERPAADDAGVERLAVDPYYTTQQMSSSYITLHDRGVVTDVYFDVTYHNVIRFFDDFGQGLIFSAIS